MQNYIQCKECCHKCKKMKMLNKDVFFIIIIYFYFLMKAL